MGKYTQQGSAKFDERLDSDFAQIAERVRALPDAGELKGIVLMGGYGRGEGTPLQGPTGELPFNDYDLVVVGKRLSRRRRKQLQNELLNLEKPLSEKLGIPVDLYLHTESSLRHAEPSLMNYEMRHGHRVISGPPDLLDCMPPLDLRDVSLSEGTRLLLNRGKLLLDVKLALSKEEALSLEEKERYAKFLWKNYLAFGDCALLVFHEYDIRYSVKKEKVRSFYYQRDVPNPEWMIHKYIQAIQFKNTGDWSVLEIKSLEKEFQQVVRYYLEFLLWYESKRLGVFLPSLQNYVLQLPFAPASGQHWMHNLVRNLRLLRQNAFSPSIRWSYIHPRNRLYPALWLLLSFDGQMPLDLSLGAQLLGSQPDYLTLTHRFYQLRERLA